MLWAMGPKQPYFLRHDKTQRPKNIKYRRDHAKCQTSPTPPITRPTKNRSIFVSVLLQLRE